MFFFVYSGKLKNSNNLKNGGRNLDDNIVLFDGNHEVIQRTINYKLLNVHSFQVPFSCLQDRLNLLQLYLW